jgi:hypothetical protein
VGVGGDFLIDLKSEGESGASGGGVDSRLCPRGDGVEEVFEFEAEGFGPWEVEFLEVEADCRVHDTWGGRSRSSACGEG